MYINSEKCEILLYKDFGFIYVKLIAGLVIYYIEKNRSFEQKLNIT